MRSTFPALVLSSLISIATQAALPVAVDGQPLPSLAPMLERVQTSLVNISVEVDNNGRRGRTPFSDDPFFRRFFEQRRPKQVRAQKAVGAGVIVDGDKGLVLTNEHIVRGATKITVTLNDGRQASATVIGSDVAADIAVVKVNIPRINAISLGDSDSLRAGDFVVSVGDPLGEQNTITTGVISARAKVSGLKSYQNFIQSDAAVGPGILVDLRGDLVGLNISKVAQTAGNTRIGFSTPINTALKIKDQIVKFGAPNRGFLAVQTQDITPDLAAAFNLNGVRGVAINGVEKDSGAARAGLQVGDVVLAVDSQPISRRNDLFTLIGQYFSGDRVQLTVSRKGDLLTLSTILDAFANTTRKGTMVHHRLDGATLGDINTQQASVGAIGVIVSNVKKDSVAWINGVRENDVIVSANRISVRDLASFRKAIEGKDVLHLKILRGTGSFFLLLQ